MRLFKRTNLLDDFILFIFFSLYLWMNRVKIFLSAVPKKSAWIIVTFARWLTFIICKMCVLIFWCVISSLLCSHWLSHETVLLWWKWLLYSMCARVCVFLDILLNWMSANRLKIENWSRFAEKMLAWKYRILRNVSNKRPTNYLINGYIFGKIQRNDFSV